MDSKVIGLKGEMKVSVDMDKCEYHGQCMIAAPEVFNLVGEEELEYVAEPDEGHRADVEEAADACPVQAILIED
jgi:ferredoxin